MSEHFDESQIDALMNDVLAEMANPVVRNELLTSIKQGSMTMNAAPAAPSNLLVFRTLDASARGSLSKRSVTTAVLLNVAAALLMFAFVKTAKVLTAPKVEQIAFVEPPPIPPPVPPKLAMSGGGGGQKGPTPVTHGNPPKFAPEQLNPPKAPPTIEAKLTPPVTVDVQPDMKITHTDSPNIGLANSPLVGVSMGNGKGNGLGSGNGSGIGPGTGGNMGGGLRKIGGGVSAPVILFQPEPEFSEEARKAKVAGNVLVYLQVDPQGRPTHIRVLRGIGLGLDEKAMEAVRQYRFKPAMENGHPVAVEMNVDVGFQIF